MGDQIVVLAGGLGSRMEAVAGGLPKSLVPILGEPFAHHQLRLLASQGIREVVYVIGFRGDQIKSSIGDGNEFGLAVSYVDEGDQLRGTAGALRFAHEAGSLHDVFGVVYGDSYLPVDLGPIWAAFDASESPALMTVFRNSDRWDRSNVVLEDGLVLLYDKRPEARDTRMAWIDYGYSILTRDVVERIPSETVVDLGDVYRELSMRRALAAYEVPERFYEAGSPEGVSDLERLLSSGVHGR